MIKLFESKYDDIYCKGYKCDVNPIEFVSLLEKNKLPISNIEMSEDADVGMKTFGGIYTVEQFYDLYDALKDSIDIICVNLKDINTRLITSDKATWTMYTKNELLELTEMLEVEKNK